MEQALAKLSEGLRVIVKPNAKKDEVVVWDDDKQALRVNIRAPAEGNKANIAVIKLFSKLAGKQVRIVKGFKSREKVLKIIKH